MKTWRSKPLGDGMWAPIAAAQIEEVFRSTFATAGKPAEMAIFTRHEEGSLHCEVIAYFSPVAEDAAKEVDARPCERPARDGLSLLAGDENCWSALFPECEA